MGVRFPPSGFTDRTAARAGVSYASWLRRAGGLIVDSLLIGMINYLLSGILFFASGPLSSGVLHLLYWLSVFSVIAITYDTLCLAKLHGQTPGMRVLQIRCVPVSQRGGISLPQALTRSVIADLLISVPWLFHARSGFLILIPLLAYLWPLIDQRRQTWWDHAAATVVLNDHSW